MVKYIAIWSVRPGADPGEIWKTWSEKHTDWVIERLQPDLRRYVQNKVIEALPGAEVDFFGITEMWFDDIESARSAIDRMIGGPPDEFMANIITKVRRVYAEEIEVEL